jgi:CheY-like chemotaxis protein
MKNILIVDDEPYMTRVVQVTLMGKGFELRTAHSGKDALERIQEQIPDLIILDVLMPEMSGIETMHQLDQLGLLNRIPIILLTGKGQSTLTDDIISRANATVMSKPFSPTELKQAVDWLISEPMD